MKTNRNELIRILLSGVTDDELENLVRVREEARRPIPAPRKMGVKQFIKNKETTTTATTTTSTNASSKN